MLVLVFLSVVAASLLQVAGPIFVKYIIDNQILEGRTDQLSLYVLLYLGSLAGLFLLQFLQTLTVTYIGQRVMMDMRLQLFTHVEKMSIAFFDRNPVGRLVTRLTNDVSTVEEVLSRGIVDMVYNALLLVVIVCALFYFDWRLAIAMMIYVPVLVFFVRKFAVALRETFRIQRAWLARLNAFLNENITGMAVVQLFNRQERNLGRFDDRNKGFLRISLRMTTYFAAFEPTVVLFNALTIGTIIWFSGGYVIQDELSLGTLVLFMFYMQFFFWPVRELAERSTMFQQALASCERIFGVLEEPEEVVDDPAAGTLERIEGRVEFDKVWFAYDAENWVLRGVSFDIAPGEAVAVVGATGAGKSTMMNLLNRFYDVQGGEIRVDGRSIRTLRQRELRREVGMVLQDPFIFTDSVLENIRMRDASITEEEVVQAAKEVGAHAFIERLPQGYQTYMAERGANLSTGQKQLISLARVTAFNPRIVLVMDEATASIDPETEAALQKSMNQVMAGRTSIIIAHRLNTIRHVNRILVLQHGELVEEGSHEVLLAQGGIYSRLYELQYKDQDIGV